MSAEFIEYDVVVMSQMCDLVQRKLDLVLVCPIWHLSEFENKSDLFKSRTGKEALRRGNAPGCYLLSDFLPATSNGTSCFTGSRARGFEFSRVHQIAWVASWAHPPWTRRLTDHQNTNPAQTSGRLHHIRPVIRHGEPTVRATYASWLLMCSNRLKTAWWGR